MLGDDSFSDNFEHIPEENRLPNTLSASFKHVSGFKLLATCDQEVAASTQAACHSVTSESEGKSLQSPILIKSGVSPEDARGTLRLSVGRSTTEEMIIEAAEVLKRSYLIQREFP